MNSLFNTNILPEENSELITSRTFAPHYSREHISLFLFTLQSSPGSTGCLICQHSLNTNVLLFIRLYSNTNFFMLCTHKTSIIDFNGRKPTLEETGWTEPEPTNICWTAAMLFSSCVGSNLVVVPPLRLVLRAHLANQLLNFGSPQWILWHNGAGITGRVEPLQRVVVRYLVGAVRAPPRGRLAIWCFVQMLK